MLVYLFFTEPQVFVFCNMNREEEINNLQNEILFLQQEMLKQRQLLLNLDQRLKQLSGPLNKVSPVERKTVSQQVPSFENFIGLRVMHLIGIVVLVAGLSLGVKYAIDKELNWRGSSWPTWQEPSFIFFH
jgi:hypothetical protein